ncbi:MAG: nitroreductase family protein [Spirochaetia bacterium]|nr:nitroreductase family protein [Spirochaetia bacterium]
MHVQDAMKTRKSVRSYQSRSVEKDKVDRILEAAHIAPSAMNLQEWRIVVVTDSSTIRKIVEGAVPSQKFIAETPLLFVCCAETDKANMKCGHPRYAVDLSIAVDHMMLAAVEIGLGTCWIGGFTQQPVKDILNIPEEIEVFALLPVGYPDDPSAAAKRRKSIDEIVCYDTWNF